MSDEYEGRYEIESSSSHPDHPIVHLLAMRTAIEHLHTRCHLLEIPFDQQIRGQAWMLTVAEMTLMAERLEGVDTALARTLHEQLLTSLKGISMMDEEET